MKEERQRQTAKSRSILMPQLASQVLAPFKQRTAFVIMPFKNNYRDFYELGVRDIVNSYGYSCLRADEMPCGNGMIQNILDIIVLSDIIIAEVTEHNANVYYEVGLAHALDKEVVLCTRNMDSSPSDLRGFSHLVYDDIVELRNKLDFRLKALVPTSRKDGSKTKSI